MEGIKPGRNLTTVRETNISLVIKYIHKAKVCSRADLSLITGLKQATITKIVNDLIEWGLVTETGIIEGRLGRRSIGITLNSDGYRIVGIRLNRNYITMGLFDITGRLAIRKEKSIKNSPDPQVALKTMGELIRELLEENREQRVLGIGVALPGPFFAKEGKILLMSGFPGWEQVNIKQELESRFQLPVFLEHDANCGALAEWWYGNSADCDNLLFVAMDTGVGAGIIANGEMVRGALGVAGEIGHMSIDYNGPKCECGNRGCLELYCSAGALEEEFKRERINSPEAGNEADGSADAIIRAVLAGDELARRVYAKSARFLGIGLVNAVNAFNPNIIIISDRMAQAGQFLLDIVSETLKRFLLPEIYEKLELQLGSFNEDPMLFGASALVLDNLLQQPSLAFKPGTNGAGEGEEE